MSVSFRSKDRPRNGTVGFGRTRNEKRAIFRAVFDSLSSFFAPKPHGNACNACYIHLQSTSSPGLFPQKMGGPHLFFEGKALGTRLICNFVVLPEHPQWEQRLQFLSLRVRNDEHPHHAPRDPPPPPPSSGHSLTTGNTSSKSERRRASALLRNIQNIRIYMGKNLSFL